MEENQSEQSRRDMTGVPFYIPLSVPFTGLAGEAPTVYTNPAKVVGDVEIVGGITDLTEAQAQFFIDNYPLWSSDQIPLSKLFGKLDGVKPILWHQPPTLLRRRQRIRVDLNNVGGEGAGTLVFICRQVTVAAPLQIDWRKYRGDGRVDVAVVDSDFNGASVLNDLEGPTPTPIIDEDFIWKDLHTTLEDAQVRISGIDGRLWMEEFVPVWAVAGRAGSALPNMPVRPNVVIPSGYAVTFEFKNVGDGVTPETSGAVYLGGQRAGRIVNL